MNDVTIEELVKWKDWKDSFDELTAAILGRSHGPLPLLRLDVDYPYFEVYDEMGLPHGYRVRVYTGGSACFARSVSSGSNTSRTRSRDSRNRMHPTATRMSG